MSIVLSLLFFNAPLAELVDALDLKSGTYYSMWVRSPQGVLRKIVNYHGDYPRVFLIFLFKKGTHSSSPCGIVWFFMWDML